MLRFCFYFILFLFLIPFHVVSTFLRVLRECFVSASASDQEALLAFNSALTPEYNPLPTTWNPNVSFCNWTGVICSPRTQRVVSLNVSSMGLQGTISPLLGNLSFLRILNLSINHFHGHIPYQLGNLFRLKELYLFGNELQGSIPPTLGGCRSLQTLSLSYNNFTGNIPTELCVLPELYFFKLYSNNLTGTVPACLGNISSLQALDLGTNNLRGTIPSELGMLSRVTVIRLDFNHLTGQIPSSLSNCTNLQLLSIIENQLTGYIPVDLCSKNTQLMEVYLDDNQLSGGIPTSLYNCTKFQVLHLAYNNLSGVVPMELGKLTQLRFLSLGDNQLGSTTTVPVLITALANCSSLERIYLFGNNFTGQLPFSLGLLSPKLTCLRLESNLLIGEIPRSIANLTSLIVLDLEDNLLKDNLLTHIIPQTFNNLQKLQELYMGYNNLQGIIPKEIGQLKNLWLLGMEANNLSGRIPNSIAHLQQLRYLYIHHNQLSGNIPSNLGKCVNLLDLDLSHNMLSGHIPLEVANLANLAFSFNLSNNLLRGPVPMGMSEMTMVQAIDISANRFTGYIPSGLGSCKELEYLNLSCNALEGPIPMSLGELQNLQNMDFSSNNLSGGIPMSLENLKMLKQLNFSFNNLSGEVPKSGVFKKLGPTSFMGNPGLCGPWVRLSPCSAQKHKSVSHLKRVVIPIAVAFTIVSCFLLGIPWRQNCKRHIPIEVGASLNVGHRRISYGEIISATEEFSDANLLGVGSFGKVYKGVLNDDTLVAVKLLNLENEGAHKSFDKECKVLSKVRHRNLIRIITSYSDLQIKALIFPLMPNGSLEKWLYPAGEVDSGFSLIQRLNIAIDIAHAMVYLHHHCFMQVIHCDLKPNNVLLGEDMTAYLIDFGIATICFANSEDSALASTHALKGSTGYIPPEYGLGGCVTTKGDVYSYGIVLLEMLTKKKPTHNMFVEGMNLQKWVGSSFPNRVVEVVDRSLLRTSTITEDDKELNCISHLINVGLLCTKESPQERPTMIDIVHQLENIRDTFLGLAGIPKIQSITTHLLSSTSVACNNTDEDQISSTF